MEIPRLDKCRIAKFTLFKVIGTYALNINWVDF